MKLLHVCWITLCLLLIGCFKDYPDQVIAPANPELLSKGKELVQGLAACGRCHGQLPIPDSALSGGQNVYDLYGSVSVPNITPSVSGIGGWSDESLLQAIRGNWGNKTKYRSPEVHRGYEWLSDKDALAIVSYIKSLPPIKHEVPRRKLSFLDRNTTGFFEGQKQVHGFVPAVSKKNQLQYGKYLVNHVARCGYCHSTPETVLSNEGYLLGRELTASDGSITAPALVGNKETMSSWSESQISEYFRRGIKPDGSQVDPEKCPIPFFQNALEEDVQSIALYIRSLT